MPHSSLPSLLQLAMSQSSDTVEKNEFFYQCFRAKIDPDFITETNLKNQLIQMYHSETKPKEILETKSKERLVTKKQLIYTLHKPAPRKHKRNKIIVHGVDDQWEADLIDIKKFKKDNQHICYLLSVIDVFSKFAWVVPLQNKSSFAVSKGFENILKKGRTPNKLRTDKGKVFLNNNFEVICKKYNIQQFTSNDLVIKCAVIERFNRTIKNKIFAYFTANSTRKYFNVLQDFVTSYNSSYYRSIKMAPVQVNEDNGHLVFKSFYGVDTMTDLLKT